MLWRHDQSSRSGQRLPSPTLPFLTPGHAHLLTIFACLPRKEFHVPCGTATLRYAFRVSVEYRTCNPLEELPSFPPRITSMQGFTEVPLADRQKSKLVI